MKRFKVCMVGSYGVGKTSLSRRFVHQVFGEEYRSTIGVGIDTVERTLANGEETKLVIWDVAGGDNLSEINRGYLEGAAGFLYVVDGTRQTSLDAVRTIQSECAWSGLDVPFLVLYNKSDLKQLWSVEVDDKDRWGEKCIDVFITSCRSGENVEESFTLLAEKLVAG